VKRILLALVAAAGPAHADVQAGNWEMTVTTSVEGTAGGMAPVTQTKCISREDARDPSRLIGSGAGCTFSNKRDTGSQITFDVTCTGQVPMTGGGVVRYTPQTFDGSVEITANLGNQRLVTSSRIAGRRLGDCKS
jgi:hypothetical protein